VVAQGSKTILLELNPLSAATNHNGGALHFGADGKLYISVGDNAYGANAQDLTNLLGKMLRLNPDGTIPSDNPFMQSPTARHEIWAYGLRNPFTFAFKGSLLYINDVGENTWKKSIWASRRKLWVAYHRGANNQPSVQISNLLLWA